MENRKKRFAYIKLAILIFIIVGLPVILFFTCRDTLFSKEWLANLPEFIMQYKGYAAAVLIGIQILQVIICVIPGQPIQLAASYLFGVLKGYLISIIGAVIGAFIAFYIARILGKDALETIFGKEKVNDYHRKLNSGKGLTAVRSSEGSRGIRCRSIRHADQTVSYSIHDRKITGNAGKPAYRILSQQQELCSYRDPCRSYGSHPDNLLRQEKTARGDAR